MIEQEDIELKIKALIDYELNKHVSVYSKKPVTKTTRNEIYLIVADQIGVHKVMVRRIARKLIVDYVVKLGILQNNLNFQIKPKKSDTKIKGM